MKSQPVLYPFLLAAFPIVRLAAQNAREVGPADLLAPVAIAATATAAAWLLLRWALKDGHRAALVVAPAAVMFLTFDVTCTGLDNLGTNLADCWVPADVHVPTWAVLTSEAALLAALAWVAARRPKAPGRWTAALNVFALILMAMPIGQAATTWARMPARPAPPAPLAALAPTPRRPDIYYIILDSFARGDVLRRQFGYDIEPFFRRLEAKGFRVARGSTSNYCQTPLSLSSSLNGMYLPRAKTDEEATRPHDKALFRENAVIRSLRPLGYEFVSFSSGFDFTEFPGNDVYYAPRPFPGGFPRMLLDATPARLLWPNPESLDQFTMARERTLYLFDRLPEVAKIPGPTFTMAHVMAPHPPFLFGEDGEDVSPRAKQYVLSDGDSYRYFYGGDETYVPGYRAQASYMLKRVERAIDAILADSPEPPIIVLQSDHGSGMHLNMESAEDTDHRERMSIINAMYLPGGRYEGFDDRITPVNEFRVVLNNEFGVGLPLLPQECFYSTWARPYDFLNVTAQVRGDASPPGMATAPPPPASAPEPGRRGL